MVGIKLKDFQDKCVDELLENTLMSEKNKIVLKSPTGSGKTIILIKFVEDYLKDNDNTVFVWLTPGSGELVDQSRNKMNKFSPSIVTKNLNDVLTTGFNNKDVAFINWEKVSQDKNKALREQEKKNLLERIDEAKNNGLKFILIIDEEHRNKTDKTKAIIDAFEGAMEIRVSATPLENVDIDIKETDVISSGLITKALYINENVENEAVVEDQTQFLIDLALKKKKEIEVECQNKGIKYNPLIVIQFPNESDSYINKVEKYLSTKNITYNNYRLAKWMAGKDNNINTEDISENQSEQDVLLMKQAISTGWDCPRAKILVKLRENMNEVFETQVIGRIRRMPEGKHYNNDLLDNCYLYTFDEDFETQVKQEIGKNACNIKFVKLKEDADIQNLILKKELKDNENDGFASRKAYKIINEFFINKYQLTGNIKNNELLLKTNGFNLNKNIEHKIATGELIEIGSTNINDNVDKIKINEVVNTHINGIDLRHSIGVLSKVAFMKYEVVRPILERMFLFNPLDLSSKKILKLSKKDFYAFIINNEDILKNDFREAVSHYDIQISLKDVKTMDFKIPNPGRIKYDKNSKSGIIQKKNVYEDAPASNVRSGPEIMFENYCEQSPKIKWWYKNGETSQEFLSIVYRNSMHKEFLFYPDYIVKDTKGNLWIIETKGGENLQGESKNIDITIEFKYEALKKYCEKYKIHWGFIRDFDKDKQLYISNSETYIEDMESDEWKLLDEVF